MSEITEINIKVTEINIKSSDSNHKSKDSKTIEKTPLNIQKDSQKIIKKATELTSIAKKLSNDVNEYDGKIISDENYQSNPNLASELYSISHFDSSQSDSTPYGPNTVSQDENSLEEINVQQDTDNCYGGPVNIMTFATESFQDGVESHYMWQVGTDKISYLLIKSSGEIEILDQIPVLATLNNGFDEIENTSFEIYGALSLKNLTVPQVDNLLGSLFDPKSGNSDLTYASRMGNGLYALVNHQNHLYVQYGDTIFAYRFSGSTIEQVYSLPNAIDLILSKATPSNPNPNPGLADQMQVGIIGICSSYNEQDNEISPDGKLIVALNCGVAVLHPALDSYGSNPDDAVLDYFPFDINEVATNSISVDSDNGIYVASTLVTTNTDNSSVESALGRMRKLIWNGQNIEIGWEANYEACVETPPLIKKGLGTGSTPTLMGFGDDEEKLVVITDGNKRMKLVAFWRDEIPEAAPPASTNSGSVYSDARVAGIIDISCGLSQTGQSWLQSEQSVVVSGYDAFVVNNMPNDESINQSLSQIQDMDSFVGNSILQSAVVGPILGGPQGSERLTWVTQENAGLNGNGSWGWQSVWTKENVYSTSMVPICAQVDNKKLAIVSGYNIEKSQWELVGLDWNSNQEGSIVHRTLFGESNLGNGAYSIPQYLPNGSLLFNSVVGPRLITMT